MVGLMQRIDQREQAAPRAWSGCGRKRPVWPGNWQRLRRS